MPRQSHLVAALAMIAFAAVPLATPRQHASAFSYLQNGSFESGTDAWRAGNAVLTAVGAGDVPPVDGAMSARVLTQGGDFTVSQTLFDVPPGAYAVSASVRRSDAATQIYLQLTVADIPKPQVLAAGGITDEWMRLSGQVYVTAFSQVRVAIGGKGSGDVYIDDVHFDGAPPITATPTPPSTKTPGASATTPPTSTRTATPTKTAPATRTATEAAAPLMVGAALRNEGFEESEGTGSPASWHRYGGALTLTSDRVRSGDYAARFESSTDSTKWFYQPVAVEPGATYEFAAWIAGDDAGAASALLRVSWYESEDTSGSALAITDSTERLDAPGPGYRYLTTGAALAPDDARSARLRVLLAPVSAAYAVIYVDDTTFGPVEPQALAATAIPAAAASEGESALGDSAAPIRSVLGTSAKLPHGAAPQSSGASLAPSAGVVINEVLYDPDGAAPDSAAEWVELYNSSDTAADLSGWSLADGAAGDTIPQLQLQPHEYAIFAASDSFKSAYPLFRGALVTAGGRIGNSLGNDGDRLWLRDASGAVIDAISWGTDETVLSPAIPDVPAGHSIERRAPGKDTNTGEDFVDNESPSPGGPIAAVIAKPHPKAASSTPVEIVPAADSYRWLPWALASISAVALLVALAWRLLPSVKQCLRVRT